MSKYLFFISIFALLSALTGCAGRHTEPLVANGYLVEGKLAVLNAGQNQSANFRWRQQDDRYEVEVWGPLGQGRTQFRGTADEVIVSQGADVVAQGDPLQVMQAHLGYSLPVGVMAAWLRGSRGPDSEVVDRDDLGRLIEFDEQNWRVKLSRFRQIQPNSNHFQPTRIVARQGSQRVTVAIRNFVQ